MQHRRACAFGSRILVALLALAFVAESGHAQEEAQAREKTYEPGYDHQKRNTKGEVEVEVEVGAEIGAEIGAELEIEIDQLPPNECLSEGYTSINTVTVLFDRFDVADGSARISDQGAGVLYDGHRFLFPESRLDDVDVLRAFLTDAAEAKREILFGKLPILSSPYEVDFQYPIDSRMDLLSMILRETGPLERFPDNVLITADLVRYTTPSGVTVRALELDQAPLNTELEAYVPEAGAVAVIETPDEQAEVYMFGKQLARGDRVLGELTAWRAVDSPSSLDVPLDARLDAPSRAAPAIVLHSGNALLAYPDALVPSCIEAVASAEITALVPRKSDLGLGIDRLTAASVAGGLPYVAANVFDARHKDVRPFPRLKFRREQEGLQIAIIGLVGPEQLEELPAAVRSQWRIEDPILALEHVIEDLRRTEGRPDLIIVLAGATGESLARIQGARDVDLVLGDLSRDDLSPVRETIQLARDVPRERVRGPRPIATLRTSPYAVGRIKVRFELPGPTSKLSRARLTQIRHETRPVLEEGPVDATLRHLWRPIEETRIKKHAIVALPDITPFVARYPELEPLIYGERILHQNGFRSYERHYPPRYSDALWVRLVGNLLKEATGADVAISRNLPRNWDMVGDVHQGQLEGWLQTTDSVRLLRISGENLLGLADTLAAQRSDSSVGAESLIMSVGIDVDRRLVAGHAIEPRATYTVATTDTVLAMSRVAKVIASGDVEERFTRTADDRMVADASGDEVLLRDAILARIRRWQDAEGVFERDRYAVRVVDVASDNDPDEANDFERALLDRPDEVSHRWVLAIDRLSLQGSRYKNSKYIGDYAATRQTRATTPDFYSIGHQADVALIYEGPDVAWETRVASAFDRAVFKVGDDESVQEQADDILAYTELRLNATTLRVGDGAEDAGVRLVPFVQTAFDTEFTATPNSSSEHPDATYPHQKIWRSSAGCVMYPGPRLKELRLGAVLQYDFSESRAHRDLGVMAAYRFGAPLGPLRVESNLDLIYLPSDGDDRPEDFAFYGTWFNRLLAPIYAGFSVFVSADLVFMAGKTNVQPRPATSLILAAGFDLTALLTL